MQRDDLEQDLMYLAKQSGLDQVDLDTHVQFCINRGINDFWNSYGWTWATRDYELEITSEDERYELPSDFQAVRTVRQKASYYGGPVTYLSKEQFDREFPKPTAWIAGYPQVCTVYGDRKDEKQYIKFARVPESSTTIYIDMYTTAGSVEAVPEGFGSGLILSIEKYLYKVGTNARFQAQQIYDVEVRRLHAVDSQYRGHITSLLAAQGMQMIPWGPRTWFG